MRRKRKVTKKKASSVSSDFMDEFLVPDLEELRDDIDSEEMEYEEQYKLQSGSNIFYMVDCKKSWGLEKKYPWTKWYIHFFNKELEKALGVDFPEGMPRAFACPKKHKGELCLTCNQVDDLKFGGKSDKFIASKLRISLNYWSNIIPADNTKVVCKMRFPNSIKESLISAIGSGALFFNARRMMPIKVTRTGVDINSKYSTRVITRRTKDLDFLELTEDHYNNMFDLTKLYPDAPKTSEMAGYLMDMFPDSDYDFEEYLDEEDYDDTDYDEEYDN